MLSPIATINLANYRSNIKYIKSLLGPSQITPVIKANAYGHGYSKIAQILSEEAIDTVCVATYNEILEILNENLNLNILHLGKMSISDDVLNDNVIFSINTLDDIENINSICSAKRKKVRCHIKVDTGMNRMGCEMDEFEKIFKSICDSDFISLEAIYSHLACSENDSAKSNEKQILNFNHLISITKQYDLKYHLLNSGGVFNYSDYMFDFCRIGLSTYGISPLGLINEKLKPVMKLSAPVLLVKNLYKGETVGYGCTFIAKRTMRIALIQCGYADGVPRDFGNKGFVFYGDYELPIIGRVSMDLMCIDISNVDESICISEVVIWGGEKCSSRLEIIADKFNSIPYVYLTGLSSRVKRIYVEK